MIYLYLFLDLMAHQDVAGDNPDWNEDGLFGVDENLPLHNAEGDLEGNDATLLVHGEAQPNSSDIEVHQGKTLAYLGLPHSRLVQ